MHYEVHYKASAKIGADRTFWCLNCDFKCPALVIGSASVTTKTHGRDYSEAAALTAEFEANRAAKEDARHAFALYLCPKCGETDSADMHRYRVGAIVRALIAAALFALVGYAVSKLIAGSYNPDLELWRKVGVAVGALVGVLAALLERWLKLYFLRGQVRLFPDHAPSADMAKL